MIAYQKKVNGSTPAATLGCRMDGEMEKKRKVIVRSFSKARDLYASRGTLAFSMADLEVGAEFLQVKLLLEAASYPIGN